MSTDQIRRLQELSGIYEESEEGSFIGFMKVYNFAKDLPRENDRTKWRDMMSSMLQLAHRVADPVSNRLPNERMKTLELPSKEVEKIFNDYDPSGKTFEELMSTSSD